MDPVVTWTSSCAVWCPVRCASPVLDEFWGGAAGDLPGGDGAHRIHQTTFLSPVSGHGEQFVVGVRTALRNLQ